MPHFLQPEASARRLCLVANDFDLVMRNGGIGTYNWLLAHLLAARGWYVHVLYCGDPPRRRDAERLAARLRTAGIGWSCLDDFPLPDRLQVPGATDVAPVLRTERVRHALEELHRRHRFALAEFGEYGGLGFRAIQARRAGTAFADLPMIVKLHSSSQWLREGNRQWMADPAEVELDFCERYAFEHADVQLSPTQYMLDYARRIGWEVRADARVLAYPFPRAEHVPAAPADGTPEIVFFGRLETRKGLEVFLKAVRELPRGVPVTLLGKVNFLWDKKPATDLIRKEMRGRRCKLRTRYSREQALAYLAAGNRLAVVPSLIDNSPFAVIECATNRIPFIASSAGGVPELLASPEARARLLFEPTPRDLLRCLREYLGTDPAVLAALRERVQEDMDVAANNRMVAEAYDTLASKGCQPPVRIAQQGVDTPRSPGRPLVTVAIAHCDMGAYLPGTLASLAAQTCGNLEVLVIDDGSTNPLSREVFDEQERHHPQFRFLRQANAGIGATRNRGLAEARGEFFLPMDADNLACPHMIETLLAALQRNPGLSATTCYCLAFREPEDLAGGNFLYAQRPTGGPHLLAAIKNVYGDANALFRTEVFRAVGGYETDRDCSAEDLEAFVKLVNAGHKIGVVPEYLYFYRCLETGFSRITDSYLNQQRVLRQYFGIDRLPTAEGMALWTTLVSLQKANDAMALQVRSLRYRVADGVDSLVARLPAVKNGLRWLLRSGGKALRYFRESRQ
jgi:glycosyltransferase involved in cell wall biosynthesis